MAARTSKTKDVSKSKEAVNPDATKILSFRVSPDVYREIEAYARTQRNELGQTLSVPVATRRLFKKALADLNSKDAKKNSVG